MAEYIVKISREKMIEADGEEEAEDIFFENYAEEMTNNTTTNEDLFDIEIIKKE
jgi:hypothetical protein